MLKRFLKYFTLTEKLLWLFSAVLIAVSYFLFSNDGYITLVSSIVGVTAIILNAKGNPAGQACMIAFSITYAVISYSFSYYGEMITYLGMSMPMAAVGLISWLRNPFKGNKAEVEVNRISKKETALMFILSGGVTVLFYFILKKFGTANLIPSTFSVTTSFLASYLSFRRSPYFALAYASNDIVLIVLWVLASMKDISYISVTVCFAAFLANDMYGFISWKRMEKRQGNILRAEKEYEERLQNEGTCN